GAPFAYRFVAGNDAGFPKEVTIAQVLAPGIFYAYGFRNSGFTIMAGVQASPDLRKVTLSDTEVENRAAFRYGVNISYDIPFFTLVKKRKVCKDIGVN
ncbi:MAG TPA: hypothetical protein VFV37_03350, partial [Luteibaculaceae bacterium]|nr:hypothetical protein [Luteibaculaceae bacterium]